MWSAETDRGAAAAGGGDARISEEVKRNLLDILKSQHGITVDGLKIHYRDTFGRKLDFRKHGFDNLLDMLKTIQEIR